MTTVVRSLGEFLIQEANNLGGVRPQVEQLQRQLIRMQCFLEAADARPKGGTDEIIIRNGVAEIREASYDAEAAIATFVVKIAFRTTGRSDQFPFILKRYLCIFKECLALCEVRSEINTINTRIDNILTTVSQSCEILNSAGVGESSSSTSMAERQRQLRRSYTHIVEEDVVGTEEDVKAIVDLLVKENARYRVVSIWGMGGLGKTTLAKTVYKHIEISRHFKCVAWAYISQQCNTRQVLEVILIKLLSLSKEGREEIAKLNLDELVKKLRQVQSEKKCLVILDDIWNDEDWDSLSGGFPNTTEVGSKILLTTRNENVPKHVDQRVLYKLRHLTEKESWELFEKTIFRRNGGTDSGVLDTNMEALGREMVKLCAGLPLAIIMFGGLLTTKHTLRDWEMVYQNVRSHDWRYDHIHGYNGVSEVLALSYHDLPDQLKQCFLYFGHFPEDFEIDAKRLYNLWIADDIIIDADRVGNETIMDVAKRYLGALAQRCMVQVQVEEYTYEINYCRIHHHMLDLCLVEAKKNNFLRIIHLQHKTVHLTDYFSKTLTTTTLEIRKLAIHLNRDIKRVVLPDLVTTKQLRSILFYNPRRDNESSIELKSHFKHFKLLKNLDLEGFKFDEQLVKSIGNLICLRYLSFRRCFIPKWHSSICKLKFLQTLDLRGCNFNLGEEIVLHSMEGLRHLFISLNLNFRNKFKLDGLRKLETFEGFNTWDCDVNDLFKLINLRQLEATFSETENSQDFEAFLDYVNISAIRQASLSVYFSFEEEKLTILKQLLGCHHLYKLSVFGFIPELPKYLDFSSSIKKLQLCSCKLQEDPMQTLERLLHLQFLNLDFDAFVGDKMVCSDNGFPKLKTLELHCLKHFKEWEVEIGALPNLTVLAIHYCQGLEMVPEGLRFIATLQQFTIQEMSENFNNKLRGVNGEEGEDFYKVRHVSSVNIRR